MFLNPFNKTYKILLYLFFIVYFWCHILTFTTVLVKILVCMHSFNAENASSKTT